MDGICIEVGKVDDREFGGTISHFISDHVRPIHRGSKQWSMIVTILAPIDGGRCGARAE
jgi:hypothetical protein